MNDMAVSFIAAPQRAPIRPTARPWMAWWEASGERLAR
jgi:hypothetical protein